MKSLSQLTESVEASARAHGDCINKPLGVRDGFLYFDATWHCLDGGFTGSPYGYAVDVETGEARPCTRDEQEEMELRSFYASLGPIPK